MLNKLTSSLAAVVLSATLALPAVAGNLLSTTALEAVRQASDGDVSGFDLTILHINDHHSHLDPDTGAKLKFAGRDGANTKAEMGGFARVVSAIRQLQPQHANVLTLHAGDAITGTIYYSLFKGEVDAAVMNQVCFDAFALGNHEFDDSDAGLARFLGYLNQPGGACRTPVLAANVVPEVGTPLRPDADTSLIQPYLVKEVGGQRIGIIGLDIAGKTQNSSSPLKTTQFLDEPATAQRYIDVLQAQGIDKIVLLTHYQYANDVRMAGQLRGVDVIVGGDSHSLLGEQFAEFGLNPVGPYPTKATNLDGDPVCIVQAWQYSNVVGELHVGFDAAGRVNDCSGTPYLLLGERFKRDGEALQGAELQKVLETIDATPALLRIAPDAATQAIVDSFNEDIEALKQQVVGIVADDLCLERIPGQGRSAICDVAATRANGGDIQQLVTEAFLRRSFEADIAIQNAGGVRIDIPAGPLTVNDVYTLLPFSNTLVNLEMTGAEVKQVLREAVANFADGDGSTGSYPYAANLRFDLDLSQPAGSRFSNIQIRRKGTTEWLPLQDDDRVTVVTNSFVANGGDNYRTFETVSNDGRVTDTFIDYAQGFIDYLQQDLGGARPGDPLLATAPSVLAVPCENYSTQLFVNRDGQQQQPDPKHPRACR